VKVVQSNFDAEKYLSQILVVMRNSGQLPRGEYYIADYDLSLIDLSSMSTVRINAAEGDPKSQAFAAIGIVAVLEGGGGAECSHAMMGHLLLLDVCTGSLQHRMSTKVQSCHPHLLQQSGFVQRLRDTWRKAIEDPTTEEHRLRVTTKLDNDALLHGRCLQFLQNHTYPVVVLPPN